MLIVGNVTKDVYLRLDGRRNKFEMDGDGVAWLDLAFNGASHYFYARHAVFGGAAVSLEVLSRFGLGARIAGSEMGFYDGQLADTGVSEIYRYVLCRDDDIVYFSPSERRATKWQAPEESIDWIYVDRSVEISRELTEEILKYLDSATRVKLALFVGKRTNKMHMHKLKERADLIFTEVEGEECVADKCICISKDVIRFGGKQIDWSLRRQDLMTHLTTNSIIAASILGAVAKGKSVDETLLLARANVENANLDGALDLKRLEEMIVGEDYRVKNEIKKENKMTEIQENTRKLMAKGKGILAADESGGSIKKKFESMGIEDTEQNRRDYRNIFFTTPDLEKYASGVILFDETARQLADNGENFVKFLSERGVIPGIKVDQGLENFEGSDEKWTKGLDGLPERLAEYYRMGARFAKWRAAFEISEGTPSEMAIAKNAGILAEYAKDCQEARIVPIVEPEVIYDSYCTIGQNAEITGRILDKLFMELAVHDVDLAACILKVNMVLAGKQYETQSTPEEVGRETAKVLREHVPEGLAGVVFLSGGQATEQATENLHAVINEGPFPWPVTFSFARALQDPALYAWRGDNANADAAREAFRERLVANAEALTKKRD